MLFGMSRFWSTLSRHIWLFRLLFFLKHPAREIKSFLLPLIPYQSPSVGSEAGFHGDLVYQKCVALLLEIVPFTVAVETGTWQGNSTVFMSEHFKKQIITCEVIGMYYRECKLKLRNIENIKIIEGSSPSVLEDVTRDSQLFETPFFFLDAHWFDYWILEEELKILGGLKKWVAVIDDFEVPDRPEFKYDKWTRGDQEIKNSFQFIKPLLVSRGANFNFLVPNYNEEKIQNNIDQKHTLRGHVVIFKNLRQEFLRFATEDFVEQHYSDFDPRH